MVNYIKPIQFNNMKHTDYSRSYLARLCELGVANSELVSKCFLPNILNVLIHYGNLHAEKTFNLIEADIEVLSHS